MPPEAPERIRVAAQAQGLFDLTVVEQHAKGIHTNCDVAECAAAEWYRRQMRL